MIEITREYLASQGLSETFPQRFWSKVKKTGMCWLWIGGTNENGYGIIGKGNNASGFIKAHRASWVLTNGAIPEGKCVLHHCDNPPCVRPEHLFLGTRLDNMRDAREKLRFPIGDEHWNVKISDADVLALRSEYKKYSKNQHQLAKKYGISVFTLRRICYGTQRIHVI